MTDVSVIFCTRDRAVHLPAAIRSIDAAALAAPELSVEICCVDNGSTDDTAKVLRDLEAECRTPMILMHEPGRGVARSKNRALAVATGQILVFTDDDCVLSENYFRDLARHYASVDEPLLLGGRIDLGDPTDQPFTIRTDIVASEYDGVAHPGGFIHGCNLTINRQAFEKIGLFDPRFGPGGTYKAAEDTDFVLRAYRAGVPVRYTPDMQVRHFHGRKSIDDVRRLNAGYHYGNGAMHAKYGVLDPLLARSFWWIARNGVREWFGGEAFDPVVKLSHWSLFGAHLRGFAAFVLKKGTG